MLFHLCYVMPINKIIHYIWLGNNKIDKVSSICINSWYSNLKDYEIKQWNEKNLPIDKIKKSSKFFRDCYNKKLWAFASDYLRLYLLYEYGGIYLDTDVQVIKNFDSFLDLDFFAGLESNEFVGTGVIGAKKKSNVIKKILDFYDNEIYFSPLCNNPMIFKYILDKNKYLLDKKNVIFQEKIFSPLSLIEENEYPKFTNETVSIHWYNANWNFTIKGEIFLRCKNLSWYKKPYIVLRILFRRFILKK